MPKKTVMDQERIGKFSDQLFNFIHSGKLTADAKVEAEYLYKDLEEYCLNGKWTDLSPEYKKAWLGEIIRRIKFIMPATTTTNSSKSDALAQTLSADPSLPPTEIAEIYFSQYDVNRHFQGQYNGQPSWLSGQEIIDVAKVLRGTPNKSADLRIRLYLHGSNWLAMNNRGFALHCLANVAPRRLAFDSKLSSDEQSRLHRTATDKNFDFKQSIPASRRDRKSWESMYPIRITAVPEERNSRKVVYTIAAIGMDVSGGPDSGNAEVFNTL